MTMAYYFGFEFIEARIQTSDGEVSPAIVETVIPWPNAIEVTTEEANYTFEGGGQQRVFYGTRGMSLQFRPDVLTIEDIATIFGKTVVTAGLPTGLDRLYWFGDVDERKGVAAGFIGKAYATKNDAGVETTCTIWLWIPAGVLTLGGPPAMQTGQKLGQQTYRLSATRTTKNVIGATLPTVPALGAFYAIGEEAP
jgi:hypothetical protein